MNDNLEGCMCLYMFAEESCKALQAINVYLFFHYIRSVVYNEWQIIFKNCFANSCLVQAV